MEKERDISRSEFSKVHDFERSTGQEDLPAEKKPWHPPVSWKSDGEATFELLMQLRNEWEFGLIEDADYMARKTKLLAAMDFLEF